jgi:2-amino-4-hydroxy-6-hydroxymethyldihydropteridine diphosphokinase
MAETSYAIAIGSNRRHGRHGAPAAVIAAALDALAAQGVRVVARSPIIRTAALGPAGRGFANAAAIIATTLPPPALLALLKRIEAAFGRRAGRRWGARVLDLDIALWSGGAWPARRRKAGPHRLAIPHRHMADRAFVLDPLARIAAGWRDPHSSRTIRQLRTRLRYPHPVDRTPCGQ